MGFKSGAPPFVAACRLAAGRRRIAGQPPRWAVAPAAGLFA
jgi:hypothetical protein